MKYLNALYLALAISIITTGCSTHISPTLTSTSTSKVIQDVQVYSCDNTKKLITAQSIEDAFESIGLSVPGNNNMNKPFTARFGKVHYEIYNLAMYLNSELTFKLIKKYPKFGILTPLTMSIYSNKGNINISTLTINGMSRATGVPLNDSDLIAYANLIDQALKKAMPNGHFKNLAFTPKHSQKSLQLNFNAAVNLEDGNTIDDFIDDFEAEFEAELEPYGFLFPNFMNLQEDIFDNYSYNVYDFYHTYSICKFDVIYAVSKLHPEAGAWAPCSFYIYKLKNEDKMHMGFLGVQNWITTLDIKDKESIKALTDAQKTIKQTLKELTD